MILFPSDGGKNWHIVFLPDLFFGQVDILLRIRYGPVLNYGNVKPGKFYQRSQSMSEISAQNCLVSIIQMVLAFVEQDMAILLGFSGASSTVALLALVGTRLAI